MSLFEAIKSGRRMKRAHDKNWLGPFPDGEGFTEIRLQLTDLIADDWEIEEIKEPTVTITKTQFFEAYRQAIIENIYLRLADDGIGHIMAKKLGLG